MIESIAELLAEIGFISEDYKHRKKIKAKEKKDGIKRPFQRYFLQPSTLITIAVIVFTVIASFLFFSYQNNSIYPQKTKKELVEITEWIIKWEEKFDRYPTDLNEIIGNDPIKQNWKKDAWKRDYKYVKTEKPLGFTIISAGLDGKFDTKDDIKFE